MLKDSEEILFSWHRSIENISRDIWDKCFGNTKIYNSYDYQKVLENSDLSGIVFHYITAQKQNVVVAIAVCFEYDLPLEILAEKPLRTCVDFVKKFYKRFLTVKTFFSGHLTAVCDHMFGFDSSCHQIEKQELLKELGKQIIQKSKLLGSKITLIKEIPGEELVFFKEALGETFIFAESLPNSHLFLNSDVSYHDQIRSKYKNLRKVRMKQFSESGLTWEICNNCDSIDDIIENLYLKTLSRSKNKFECLNSKFFTNVSKEIPNAFFILVKKQYDIVGFSFNIMGKNSMQGLYLGYEEKYKGIIYFNLFYKFLDEAILHRKENVWLGQTSYEVKQAMGASLHKLYLGLYSSNKFTMFMLKKLRKTLFPEVVPLSRNVWKSIER